MKNLLVTFIFIFLVHLLFAQQHPFVLLNNNFDISSQSTMNVEQYSANNQMSILSNDGKLPLTDFQITEISIRMDSVIYTEDDLTWKEICTYDAQGNLLVSYWQMYEAGIWQNTELLTYTYDDNGNRLTFTEQLWDNNDWMYNKLFTSTYDFNNNWITYLNQNWVLDEWENNFLETYTYDTDNNLLTYTHQYWTNETWVNVRLNTFNYDSNGNMLTWLVQNNTLDSTYLDTYTYDINGNEITHLLQTFIDESWHNFIIMISSYDVNGNKLSRISQFWTNNGWKNEMQDCYTYDNNGNRLSVLYQYYGEDELWRNSYYSEFTYNTENNLVMEIDKDWEDEEWIYDSKVAYELIQGKITAIAYQWDGENWIENSDSETLNIYMDGEWISSYWAKYLELYYSDITGIDEQSGKFVKSPLTLYPNPAKDQLTIEINHNTDNYKLELFNQSGLKVKSFDWYSNLGTAINLNVESIPPGLYFLQATDGKQSFSRKLIISR